MRYDEFPAPETLRHAIRCIWHLQIEDSAALPDRVVPDGCSEIIINRAEAFHRSNGHGPWKQQASVLFVGQLKRSIMLLPGTTVDLIGIRFQPAGAYALLGLPMHEFTDLDVDLRVIAPRLCDDLIDAVSCKSGQAQSLGLAKAFLREQERRTWRPRSSSILPTILAAFDHGLGHAGRASDLLARSRRVIEREFREQVGLSPKSYQRISRMQRFLADVEMGHPDRSLAGLALRHGFVDQPHLNREFRLLIGLTPGAWLSERPELAQVFLKQDESHFYKSKSS